MCALLWPAKGRTGDAHSRYDASWHNRRLLCHNHLLLLLLLLLSVPLLVVLETPMGKYLQ